MKIRVLLVLSATKTMLKTATLNKVFRDFESAKWWCCVQAARRKIGVSGVLESASSMSPVECCNFLVLVNQDAEGIFA